MDDIIRRRAIDHSEVPLPKSEDVSVVSLSSIPMGSKLYYMDFPGISSQIK